MTGKEAHPLDPLAYLGRLALLCKDVRRADHDVGVRIVQELAGDDGAPGLKGVEGERGDVVERCVAEQADERALPFLSVQLRERKADKVREHSCTALAWFEVRAGPSLMNGEGE